MNNFNQKLIVDVFTEEDFIIASTSFILPTLIPLGYAYKLREPYPTFFINEATISNDHSVTLKTDPLLLDGPNDQAICFLMKFLPNVHFKKPRRKKDSPKEFFLVPPNQHHFIYDDHQNVMKCSICGKEQ